jgi:hypothetical protein
MKSILLLSLTLGMGWSAPILTTPNGGVFNAPLGTMLSLPFSITPDSSAFVVIQSVQGTVTRSPGEIYAITDVLSNFVAANSYALAPQNPVTQPWTETVTPQFAGAAGAVGTVFVPLTATAGQATGTIQVSFELFNLDPFVDPLAVSLGTGILEALFVVNFVGAAAIPEPAVCVMVACGLGMLLLRGRMRVAPN